MRVYVHHVCLHPHSPICIIVTAMHPVPWAPTSAMRTHALAVHSIVSHALTI